MEFIRKSLNVCRVYIVKITLIGFSFLIELLLNTIIYTSAIVFGVINCIFFMFFYLINQYYSYESNVFNRKRAQLSSFGYSIRNNSSIFLDIVLDIFAFALFGLFRLEIKLIKLLLDVFFVTTNSFYEDVCAYVLVRLLNTARFNIKKTSSIIYTQNYDFFILRCSNVIGVFDEIKHKNYSFMDEYPMLKQINEQIIAFKDMLIEFLKPFPKFFSSRLYMYLSSNELNNTFNGEGAPKVFFLTTFFGLLMLLTYILNPEWHNEYHATIDALQLEPEGMISLMHAFIVVVVSLLCIALSFMVGVLHSIYELLNFIFIGPCDRLSKVWSLYNLPSEALDHSTSSEAEETLIKNKSPIVPGLPLDSSSLVKSLEDSLSA